MLRASLLLGSVLCAACVVDDGQDAQAELSSLAGATVPSRGAPETLDVGEWNVEWFGATWDGPTNEPLQLANVRDVILGTDLELWALEEVVSKSQFDALVAQLPGYEGFLANDPRVASGSAYYTTAEQKVGILYKSSAITVHSARLVVTGSSADFGGRPPLEVEVTATVGNSTLDFVVIVLHAKAMGDSESYKRRLRGSLALKTYLDSSRPTDRVLVVGDFNDDVDTSIAGGASPYKNFVDDTASYTFPTKVLSDAKQKTISSGSQTIDHHLITSELAPFYVPSSAAVYRVDQYVTGYSNNTSDHYPTLTRYSLGPSGSQLIINEILANELLGSVAGEAVEIVNAGDSAADLSGYTLSDATSVRHVFAAGTTLAAGRAIVVFGGAAAIPTGVTNAVAASSGGLSLNNAGDTVALADMGGGEVDSFSYQSGLVAADGVSMNRSPDGSAAGRFVPHTDLAAASSSLGKRANGTAF
jgi:endonuclease/exonuclease/phosphatase family metal-dependent hydrolase